MIKNVEADGYIMDFECESYNCIDGKVHYVACVNVKDKTTGEILLLINVGIDFITLIDFNFQLQEFYDIETVDMNMLARLIREVRTIMEELKDIAA